VKNIKMLPWLLKKIAENQKQKLRDYREANSNLYSEIGDLESDVKEKDDFANKLVKKRNELEKEVKHLIEKIEAKNEDLLKMDVV
jgi:peptidoglycan hydrolase CwlO-like protein